MATTDEIMSLADGLRWATYHHADSENGSDDIAEASKALRTALEGLVRDAEQARHFARIHFGYAPGFYQTKCITCGKLHEMCDKRAARCIECADAAIAAQKEGV